MKKRDLALDFTSLLDVVMIILFFFIMFSHFDSEKETQKKSKELAQTKQELIQDKAEIEKRLDELKKSDDLAAKNQEALWDLEDGKTLDFLIEPLLDEKGSAKEFELKIRKGEHKEAKKEYTEEYLEIGSVKIQDNMDSEIEELFNSKGYDKDSYIFAVIYFNGETEGTKNAVDTVAEAVKSLKNKYENLYSKYFNFSDTSI